MTGSLSIVADEQIPLAEQAFSKFGNVTLVDGRSINNSLIKNTDILLVRSVTKVNELLLKNSNLKFLGSATSGVDHIDIDYLKSSKIYFSYSPGSNSQSVAEYVLNSLIVAKKKSCIPFSKMKVGIIGCGHIGSKVKKIMDILGSHCLLNDPILSNQRKDEIFTELEEVLQSDVVTLHVPLTKDCDYPTYNLVNEIFLKKLKPNVIFINTSRGEVIDEEALLAFKMDNPESVLVLDVWRNEPNINTSLLSQAFIKTPHIAGYSHEGKINATENLFNQLNHFCGTNFTFSELYIPNNIRLSPEMNGSKYDVESIISQHWNILEDNISTDYYNNLAITDRAKYYDSLRKNYSTRYEYASRTIEFSDGIDMTAFDNTVQNNLEKLGFKLNIK